MERTHLKGVMLEIYTSAVFDSRLKESAFFIIIDISHANCGCKLTFLLSLNR
jgi:hypothetical protein